MQEIQIEHCIPPHNGRYQESNLKGAAPPASHIAAKEAMPKRARPAEAEAEAKSAPEQGGDHEQEAEEEGEVAESPLEVVQSRIIAALLDPPEETVVESPLAFALGEPMVGNGLLLEFGVFSGKTVNMIALANPLSMVHGFDTFTGLPEDWRPGFPAGTFNMNGKLPKVAHNVRLHAGLFEQTLEPFLNANQGPVALAHLDADLYSATSYVLKTLAAQQRIVDGTILVFDEFINFKGWRRGEFLAFTEFIVDSPFDFEIMAQSALMELVPVLDIASSQQVAVRILLSEEEPAA